MGETATVVLTAVTADVVAFLIDSLVKDWVPFVSIIRDEIDACFETPDPLTGRIERNDPTVAGNVVDVENVIAPTGTVRFVVPVVVAVSDVAPA